MAAQRTSVHLESAVPIAASRTTGASRGREENPLPIKRDNSNLAKGRPPSLEATRLLTALADEWYRDYLESGEDERAFAVPGTRFRASWAGGCARALGYKVLENDAKVDLAAFREAHAGEPEDQVPVDELTRLEAKVREWGPTNPPSLAEMWNMGLGSIVHERFEGAIKRLWPGADCEVAVDLRPSIDGSASIDILITEEVEQERESSDGVAIATGVPFRTLLELKTKGGFGFKLAATNFKGPPEGPSLNHVTQAALAGYALDVDRVVIGYLSKENISLDLAEGVGITHDAGRFAAAWSYDRDEYRPIAEREHRRVARVFELLDQGVLPPRAIDDPEIPLQARITDPMPANTPTKGLWTVVDDDGRVLQSGTTWWCGYCWHRDRCVADGEATPVIVRGTDG